MENYAVINLDGSVFTVAPWSEIAPFSASSHYTVRLATEAEVAEAEALSAESEDEADRYDEEPRGYILGDSWYRS